MTFIQHHTPELNSYDNNYDVETDPIGEALFAAFCVKREVAQQSNALEDGIAAGHAWGRFMQHFEKSPGVSAGSAS